jgi:glycogen operon protein
VFGADCRSVNFLAAHDGFTLADMLAYEQRHNAANGEHNRDGHGENFSWNSGVEGPSDDPQVIARRAADVRALLGTLFASTGTIMLTSGDEFGRSQQGNNNAYCQSMPVDWQVRDVVLEEHVAALSRQRNARLADHAQFPEGGRWLGRDGADLTSSDWDNPALDAIGFEPPEDREAPRFRIDRAGRSVTLGE